MTVDIIFGIGFLIVSVATVAGMYWETKVIERAIKRGDFTKKSEK